MTNELEQVLADTIKDSKMAVGEAVNWAITQAPDLCEQYLAYSFYSATITLITVVVCAMLLIASVLLAFKHTSRLEQYDDAKFVIRILAVVVSVSLFVAVIVPIAISSVKDIVKIKLAPKVYLVEFASSLIKR